MENNIPTKTQTEKTDESQNELQPTTQPEPKTTKCLNCGTEFVGNFCPECGQSAETGRFTMRFIVENLLAAFTSRDGGLWFTLKNLFTRPGAMIVEILNGKRRRYFSPFPLLFFTLTVYILLFSTTGSRHEYSEVEEQYYKKQNTEQLDTTEENVVLGTPEGKKLQKIIGKGIHFYNSHYTAVQMLTLPFFLFAARACFGKSNRKRYFRAEYAIPIVYAMVMVVLYRCIVSLVYLASPDVSDRMGFYHPLALILAFAACFSKMMGLSIGKTLWRSVLTVTLYYIELFLLSLIAITIFGFFFLYKYYK